MSLQRYRNSLIWLSLSFLLFSLALATQQPAESDTGKVENEKEKKLPLEPERHVQFNSDEGTWLSLDVSPDGKSILFELVGDLYTIPIQGGTATRITQGMAFDSQPRYSPDGRWITFISDRDGAENVWISRPDGTEPRRLTKGRHNSFLSPTWTPDSQYVVVAKGGRTNDIWMHHVSGGSGIKLTGKQGGDEDQDSGPGRSSRLVRSGPQISPDGRYLYFSRKNAGSVYNQMSFSWEIYRLDLNSGDVDRITQAQGGAIRPLLSPDGSQLVYATRFETKTGLRIRNLETGQDRWLTYPVQRDDMESRGTRDAFPGYAFTPDGSEVIFTRDGKLHAVSTNGEDEREILFTAEVSQDLGPLLNFQRRVEEGSVRSRLLQDPVQSPDGSRLTFSAMAQLYVKDLPEGEPRPLTDSEIHSFKPSWSPDGQWIAFVTWNYNGDGHIWKIRTDGSAPAQRLTTIAAFYTDPVFSPDGSRIVARRGNAWMRSRTPSEFGGLRIQTDLIWLPADGGDVRLIVPARGLGSPHFTGDQERIYFYSGEGLASEGLVSMRYDGTDRKTHLKIVGKPRPGSNDPMPAQAAQISPDQKWALAKVNNQLYVMAVPPLTGATITNNVASPSLPTRRITDVGADSFAWADDGDTLTWTVGSTFFRRPFTTVDFSQSESEQSETEESEEKPEAAQSGQEPDDEEKKTEPPLEQHESVESFDVVLEFPRHQARGRVLLRGATAITMNGDEVIEEADILIEDNRIQALGAKGEVEVPSDTRELDFTGTYIVPGFVDTHAHYEMRTEGVLELHNWSFLANLAYGVTTGLDVQTSTNDYLTYQDLVEAGKMIGPRAYSTGPGVFSWSTHFENSDQARHILAKYRRYYQNHNLKSYMVGNRQQRQWVVQAANEHRLTVTTEGGLDLKLDMTHAIDGFGGNEHSLPIIPLYKDVVELFARSGTSYTPTLLVLYGGPWAENYWYETTEVHDDPKLNRFVPHNEIDRLSRRRPWFREDEHAFDEAAAQAAKIQRAGGKVGVGSHGQLQGLGFHWEMWSLSMGGMTPREVLKAATIDGAYIIGLVQDLGSLEAGKLADLVVLEKNPLEDIYNTKSIRYVMKNGELFEADTLKQVWPKEAQIEPFWWWDDRLATGGEQSGHR